MREPKGEGLLACGANTEGAKLLGSLIIHLGASCFPSLWTAGQLNCLWINSLATYWLHSVSEVHLNTRNPIMLGRDGKHSTRSKQVLVLWPLVSLPVCLPAVLRHFAPMLPFALFLFFYFSSLGFESIKVP